MMKRYLTVALALVLFLLCGMQTAADGATPNIICQHKVVHSTLNIWDQPIDMCSTLHSDGILYTCADCGYSWYEVEHEYDEKHHSWIGWEFQFSQIVYYVY